MKNFTIGENTVIDLPKLLETRLLIQANSGGGKSWVIRRLLEQTHGKVQQIVIDLEGEFSTLREKYDYILAGKEGDTPADPKTATLLARRLLELNVSAIIDLYELNHYDRKVFVKNFLTAMVNAPKELWHECLVIIDEAHVFCPEKGHSEASDAVIDLATRGRKRGYCAVLATQRLSKLHKDAAAECNNKLIGRTGLDVDMKRAAEELGFTSKEQYLSLRSLDAGEFFTFGPAISKMVTKVKVGKISTTHPSVGSRIVKSKPTPPTSKIRSVLQKLADLPQEAQQEANTVAEYKATIRDLRSQISRGIVQKKEIPMIDQVALKREISKATDPLIKENDYLRSSLKKIIALSEESVQKAFPGRWYKPESTYGRQLTPIESEKGTVIVKKFLSPRKAIVEFPSVDSSHITGPEQRILNAVAWFNSIGIEEPDATAVAFLAGYTYGAGGFNNPRGSLRVKGLIEYRGKSIVLTESGRQSAKEPDYTLTQEDLHKKVLSVLPNPEQRLLKPLLDRFPDPLSNEELASLAGYAVGTGGFNNPKGRLRTLGLVEYPSAGMVKARKILFI